MSTVNDIPLYCLVYISKSAIDGSSEEIAEEIKKILISAKNKNSRKNVTGALLYSGGYFCQAIEGELKRLENLYEKILLDPRHEKLMVVELLPIKKRSFGSWTMAFAGIDERMRPEISNILANNDEIKGEGISSTLLPMLYKIIQDHQFVFNQNVGGVEVDS